MPEVYEGIPFESDSELFVLYWLLELQDKGIIHSIERAPEILLSLPAFNVYTKTTVLKTKTKKKEATQSLLEAHYYTPEFKVKWNLPVPKSLVWDIHGLGKVKKEGIFVGHLSTDSKLITYIEVKPVHDFHNMTRAFRINQKWMWQSRQVFINLLEPISLMKSTFTPQAYLTTRKKRTERLIKWPIISCDQYLASLYSNIL